jgi:hypothetical protein
MRTLKCTEVARTTHLSLVGGKYRVEDPRSFHKIYAKHHAHGKGAYLVEKVVYPSKWYLDVDHVDSRRLNAMIGILLAYGEPCIVCIPVESKDGIHVIFTNGYVYSKEEACAKSEALLRNTSIVFDKSVYSSGLRMVGSKKGYTIDRIYMPYYRVNKKHNGCYMVDETLTSDLLSECSIHYHGPVVPQTAILLQQPHVKGCKFKGDNGGVAVGGFFSSSHMCYMELPFIHPTYARIQMTNIQKRVIKGVPTFYIYTKERYCTHLNKEHKSANVCFEISDRPVHMGKPKTIQCRCTCKCTHTGCSSFRGHAYPIPIKLLRDIIHIHTVSTTTNIKDDAHLARDNDRIDRDFFDALA